MLAGTLGTDWANCVGGYDSSKKSDAWRLVSPSSMEVVKRRQRKTVEHYHAAPSSRPSKSRSEQVRAARKIPAREAAKNQAKQIKSHRTEQLRNDRKVANKRRRESMIISDTDEGGEFSEYSDTTTGAPKKARRVSRDKSSSDGVEGPSSQNSGENQAGCSLQPMQQLIALHAISDESDATPKEISESDSRQPPQSKAGAPSTIAEHGSASLSDRDAEALKGHPISSDAAGQIPKAQNEERGYVNHQQQGPVMTSDYPDAIKDIDLLPANEEDRVQSALQHIVAASLLSEVQPNNDDLEGTVALATTCLPAAATNEEPFQGFKHSSVPLETPIVAQGVLGKDVPDLRLNETPAQPHDQAVHGTTCRLLAESKSQSNAAGIASELHQAIAKQMPLLDAQAEAAKRVKDAAEYTDPIKPVSANAFPITTDQQKLYKSLLGKVRHCRRERKFFIRKCRIERKQQKAKREKLRKEARVEIDRLGKIMSDLNNLVTAAEQQKELMVKVFAEQSAKRQAFLQEIQEEMTVVADRKVMQERLQAAKSAGEVAIVQQHEDRVRQVSGAKSSGPSMTPSLSPVEHRIDPQLDASDALQHIRVEAQPEAPMALHQAATTDMETDEPGGPEDTADLDSGARNGLEPAIEPLDASFSLGFECPAVWSHPEALNALTMAVAGHSQRNLRASRYCKKAVVGRDLSGYASRCGALPDLDNKIHYGCGTSLADVHYHCAFCQPAAVEEADTEDEMYSTDYCENCMNASGWLCPNPACASKDPKLSWNDSLLIPQDFLRSTHGCKRREFANESHLLIEDYHNLAEKVVATQYTELKGALAGLPKSCMPWRGGGRCPMYEADVGVAKKHLLFRNGLDEGVPVLIKDCASHFRDQPFSAEAMQLLAQQSADQDFKVKAQYDAHGGETQKTDDITVLEFFRPMLRSTDLSKVPPDPDICLPVESDSVLSGFKLPDFGILPEVQCKAFFEGLDSLGIGETARLDGRLNLASYLRSEKEDNANGTQRPDLGPKFYIARPKLVGRRPCCYTGRTFTPLHCDLADAVNFCCSGEVATWHMFHREDRQSLMQYLKDRYGGEVWEGVDLLWNPENHRVLDKNDFSKLAEPPYNVKPWEFIQSAGEVVVIPAGCAHQVVNGSSGHNIKVAQDFIAPESAHVSLELLDEMRRAKQEDKLQAVLTLRFAGAAGYTQLKQCRVMADSESMDME